MQRFHKLQQCALIAWAAWPASGCLAEDDRPTPGEVTFTASSDEALRNGFSTEDGWTIRYERFIASIGNTSPEECTFYSDAPYNRVLDLRLEGAQRLGIIYALGQCQIDYEVSSPWSDSLLGEGIAQADLDFMRTPASDDIVRGAGVSVMLRGVAGKDGVEKRFDWVFRNRIDYTNCSQTIDGELVQGIDFVEGAKITQDLVAHGGALFQDHERTAESLLVFDPFAAADDTYGDANGDVTLDELGLTPLADITTPDRYIDAEENWDTLEDYVYLGSLRNIVSFGIDGTWDKCEEVSTFANDRVPH